MDNKNNIEIYEWSADFETGVETIDKEHQQLFKIINKLFAIRNSGKHGRWACQEGIKFFKTHAITHFANEEAYMEKIGYKMLEQHRKIHEGFREDMLPTLEKELEQSNYSDDAVSHFLGVCSGWLIGHTLTEDMAIAGKNQNCRWCNLFSNEEQDDLRKVITQLLFNMFRLEATLISDTYAGEKFGDGVYYRIVFGAPDEDKKIEILLVFEEKLLINTIGRYLGIRSNDLDAMQLHAARYSARQFVNSAMGHFPDLAKYQFEGESFLNYTDFKSIIEKGNQQASFLFDTGKGYFAYCAIAPRLFETGLGISILHENATKNVEKYLNMRNEIKEIEKEIPRKKILVVDDSSFVQEEMKMLLGGDYSVSSVNSGIAAIRAITLDPPDLVLLDYEMPICDGAQTLEMLRSEEAFTSVPVIFLTGKNDPGSIIRVMPLKPSGYILKTAKPADIKKEIDKFFKKE